MNEISYYEEFSKKFTQYLTFYLGNDFKTYYSSNNNLDVLIKDLELQSGITIRSKAFYIPKLKVDIVFAICQNGNLIRLILIEAKYLPQLSLKDYSQLAGYLQVAKIINLGLLLLVQKGNMINKLSNDFQEILRLKKLPMCWLIDLNQFNEQYNFRTGIISYIPNNGIDWVDTNDIHGISSFEELVDVIKKSAKPENR